MKYQEIEGDLIKLALEDKFDVIAHGCNCFCRMKRGIAPQIAKAFRVDEYNYETLLWEGDINKLGQIQYYWMNPKNVRELVDTQSKIHTLAVVNAYTQYHWDTQTKPLDYEALTLCLRKINHTFKGKHIGLPLIGCHLAGGIWDKTHIDADIVHKDVKTIIQEELKDMDVTIVHYKP